MAIQKKSLIGNLTAAKKAIIATNVAPTASVAAPSRVETAKPGTQVAKFAAKHVAKNVSKQMPTFAAKPVGIALAKVAAKPLAKVAAKTSAKFAAKTSF